MVDSAVTKIYPLRKLVTTSLRTRTAPRGISGRGEQDRQRKDPYSFCLPVHKAAAHQHKLPICHYKRDTLTHKSPWKTDDKPRRHLRILALKLVSSCTWQCQNGTKNANSGALIVMKHFQEGTLSLIPPSYSVSHAEKQEGMGHKVMWLDLRNHVTSSSRPSYLQHVRLKSQGWVCKPGWSGSQAYTGMKMLLYSSQYYIYSYSRLDKQRIVSFVLNWTLKRLEVNYVLRSIKRCILSYIYHQINNEQY